MPTGYTDKISKGISVDVFILSCAKAFGACLHQRDDNLDELPKEDKPSNYHSLNITKAENELRRIEKLTHKEIERELQKEYNNEVKRIKKSINSTIELSKKYKDMLSKVYDWKPPTADHEGLKNFMIEQIKSSIDFDCNPAYDERHLNGLTLHTAEYWKNSKIKGALHDLNYHKKGHEIEVARVNRNNKWIADLYKSLPSKANI